MTVRRAQIAAALSTTRAAIVQRLDGSRLERSVLRRLFPRQFARDEPRWIDPDPVNDLARPIRFPQHGLSTMEVDTFPVPGTPAFARLVRDARRSIRVRVDALAADAPHARDALLVLAASGAPVELLGEESRWHDGHDGDVVRIARTSADDGRRCRELRSVRLRRAAHDAWWPNRGEREVSVLMATRRPEEFAAAAAHIRSQVGCTLQVVAGLHGDGWPDDAAVLLEQLPPGSLIERFGAETTLGEILTALGRRADAALVTKWDDDDWYGPDHVADLVRAYAYSGADVVGKGAEFVHLEREHTTVRRFATGAESYTWTLAGGTLLTSQAWIDEIGGWPAVPKGVDRALLRATREAGGTAYRTHGFQYVLRRSAAHAHTWAAGDEHFARTAVERRAGLDLAFADVET